MEKFAKKLKTGMIAIALSSLFTSLNAAGTFESLYFVGDDLETGLSYKNVRYESYGSKGMYFGENYNKNNLTYIKPDGYTWLKTPFEGKKVDQLSFSNTNNYAYLERINLRNDLNLSRMKDDNDEWYLTLDGGACVGDKCKLDENIISVVVPKKFKISAYEAFVFDNGEFKYKKDANFKIIDNTVTLYTNNVKGTYMKLWIKDITSSSKIYTDVTKSLEKFSEISVSKTDTETKIIMPMDNVFASAKAQANQQGKEWFKALSSTLKDKNYKEIRVDGHTDNVPINKGTFPSNWELSSARASDTVRFLIEQGVDSSKIAAVGYADTRPLVDNNSDINRAKNRRVEITIVGNADSQ